MSNSRPVRRIEVDVYDDTLEALPLLTQSYGMSQFHALNQALDLWVWLARHGAIGKVIEVRSEGRQPGTVHLRAPQTPDEVIERLINEL